MDIHEPLDRYVGENAEPVSGSVFATHGSTIKM